VEPRPPRASLPDAGKKVAFKLLTGDDERKLPALQRSAPDKLLSAVLAYRVLEIDKRLPRLRQRTRYAISRAGRRERALHGEVGE